MSSPEPTRKQRRDAAREQRRAQEEAAAAATARRRGLALIGGVVTVALVIVVIAVVASSSGGDDPKAEAGAGEVVAGQKDVAAMLGGIPQDGLTLGDPAAKVTLIEYADPQCPVCKDFADNHLPRIVEDQIRTGKVKMQVRLQTFLDQNAGGTSSRRAASAALAAGRQDRFFTYLELLYRNQGTEGSDWAGDDLLRRIARAAAPLSWPRIAQDRDSAAVAAQLGRHSAEFDRSGFTGTPSFVIRTAKGDQKGPADYTKLNDALTAATR